VGVHRSRGDARELAGRAGKAGRVGEITLQWDERKPTGEGS
jgi:hypothetical protein